MIRSFRLFPIVILAGVACGSQGQAKSSESQAQPRLQPYTAEFKITHTQTLADGTTITREGTDIRVRESSGRTMESRGDETPQADRIPATVGSVHDADGTILANWNSWSKTAHVFKMPPREQRHGCWMTDSGSMRIEWDQGSQDRPAPSRNSNSDGLVQGTVQPSKPKFEDLGTISIHGVEARGRRITRTIAAGEVGNDRTLVTVSESWRAPSLALTLRDINDDPRSGKRSRELVSLTLDEPDPALFQPPQDYQITTEELHPVACKQ